MAIKEMKTHFASNEACFQASTADVWYAAFMQRTLPADLTIATLMERLCKVPIEFDSVAVVADLGSLNLFVLASGMCNLLRCSHC